MGIIQNYLNKKLKGKQEEVRKLRWKEAQLRGKIEQAKIRKQKEGDSV